MRNRHELTEKIWGSIRPNLEDGMEIFDQIIRQWLSEKAEEIRKSYSISWGSNIPKTKNLTEILGLSKPEKSLEDKFKDRFNGMKFTHHILTPSGGSINMEDFIKELIRDAEQHFKNTDEDKR